MNREQLERDRQAAKAEALAAQQRVRELEAEIEGLKQQLGAAGYVPRPPVGEPTYDEATVPPPPLTSEG